jgi:hypothetical protein
LLEAALDRIDQLVRPSEPCDHALVEPPEPFQLQQLRPRQVEDERRHAETHHLGEREHAEHPETEKFQRKQEHHRHDEHDQGRGRRQVLDPDLDLAQWDVGDYPPDYRRKVLPQSRLKQEDEGEQD